MKNGRVALITAATLLIGGTNSLMGATVRGQLLCNNGNSAAIGIAVTVYNQQLGRSPASFTGGDGMYYLNVPPGQYVLEVWLTRQGGPQLQNVIFVNEPVTDVARIFLPTCFVQ